MKRTDRKSDCAINFALEAVGDPWSLLIIRDIAFFGKNTYSEFLDSDERIGTSILARRLRMLEITGIVIRQPSKDDGRSETYHLTAKGIDLMPIILELMAWGAKYDRETGANKKIVSAYVHNRQRVIDTTKELLRKGGSIKKAAARIFR